MSWGKVIRAVQKRGTLHPSELVALDVLQQAGRPAPEVRWAIAHPDGRVHVGGGNLCLRLLGGPQLYSSYGNARRALKRCQERREWEPAEYDEVGMTAPGMEIVEPEPEADGLVVVPVLTLLVTP